MSGTQGCRWHELQRPRSSVSPPGTAKDALPLAKLGDELTGRALGSLNLELFGCHQPFHTGTLLPVYMRFHKETSDPKPNFLIWPGVIPFRFRISGLGG